MFLLKRCAAVAFTDTAAPAAHVLHRDAAEVLAPRTGWMRVLTNIQGS
jgi:hypothetical protein